MSDDKPKVVDLKGKAVTPAGNTEPLIVELLENMLASARSGSYKACAIVLVDTDHSILTAYHIQDHHDPIRGMEWVKFKIQKGLADQ